MHWMARFYFALIIWIVALPQSAAGADTSVSSIPTVVIIDSGENTGLLVQVLIQTASEKELAAQKRQIVVGANVREDTPSRLLACIQQAASLPESQNCVAAALAAVKANSAIFLSLRSDSSSNSLQFIAHHFRVADGKTLAKLDRSCTPCSSSNQQSQFARALVRQLLRTESETKQKEDSKPVSTISTSPATGSPAKTKSSSVEVPLVPGEPTSKHSKSTLYYVGFGTGVTALLAGATLVAIDGPIIEHQVRQAKEYNTSLAGYLSIGAGVAILGVTTWLWTTEPDTSSPMGAQLVPTTNGATLLWNGQF